MFRSLWKIHAHVQASEPIHRTEHAVVERVLAHTINELRRGKVAQFCSCVYFANVIATHCAPCGSVGFALKLNTGCYVKYNHPDV